jgi:hypothetical protein
VQVAYFDYPYLTTDMGLTQVLQQLETLTART